MDWTDVRILLTGGTGSFGWAFASLLLARHPRQRLRIFSRDEWKQQRMADALRDRHPGVELWIGDVRDRERLEEAGAGCDVWVHAAALKQIPTCEAHPLEAFKTNLMGTANLLQAAARLRPRWIICLSTDKAVQPANVYGASKLGAERLAVSASLHLSPTTRTCVVRYGNVLGSRGSVVPEFQKQQQRGTLSITDPRMTRFWIPQERAAGFVLRVPELAHGGEILVPRTPSLRLVDLARIIAPEMATETVGGRLGEKLHETLLAEEESGRALELDDLYVILPAAPDDATLARYPGARRVREGFRYTSDTNCDWWEPAEIRPFLSAG